jgi:membrane protein
LNYESVLQRSEDAAATEGGGIGRVTGVSADAHAAHPARTWRSALDAFLEADPLTLAASIAFYSALSFAPILLLGMSLVVALWPGSEARLIAQMGVLLGPQVQGIAELVVQHGHRDWGWSLSGLITIGALFLSASSAAAQLEGAIQRIWAVQSPTATAATAGHPVWTWVRHRLLSLGILAVIGFFLVTSLVVSTVLGVVLTHEGNVWFVVNEAIALAVFTAAFAALFRFVPAERVPSRSLVIGALVTAVLFDAGKWILGAYLAGTDQADAYGASGAMVLLLIWVYYASLIVLVGAGLTRWMAGPLTARAPSR